MSKEVKRYDCTDGGARFCQGCYTMSECEFGEYVSWDDYEALLADRDRLAAALDSQSWEIASPNISYALREQLLGQLAGDHEPDEVLCAEDFHDWLAGAIDRIRAEHRKAEGNQPARVYASAALQGSQP